MFEKTFLSNVFYILYLNGSYLNKKPSILNEIYIFLQIYWFIFGIYLHYSSMQRRVLFLFSFARLHRHHDDRSDETTLKIATMVKIKIYRRYKANEEEEEREMASSFRRGFVEHFHASFYSEAITSARLPILDFTMGPMLSQY